MKKFRKWEGMLLFSLICLFLTACAVSTNRNETNDFAAVAEIPAADGVWDEGDQALSALRAVASTVGYLSPAEEDDGTVVEEVQGSSSLVIERIIYSARLTIITEDFDNVLVEVDDLVNRFGGFLQESNVSGTGRTRAPRWADFQIRVPSHSYRELLQILGELGELEFLNTSATNVSAQYADISSRLNLLRTQEERILALLERAEEMEDIILLESELSNIIFRIESLTGERNYLDQQVAFSTIYLSVSEIVDGERAIPNVVQWSEARGTLQTSLRVMRNFFVGLLIVLIALLPWMVVVAVIVVIVVVCVRRRRKRKIQKAIQKAEQKTEQKKEINALTD